MNTTERYRIDTLTMDGNPYRVLLQCNERGPQIGYLFIPEFQEWAVVHLRPQPSVRPVLDDARMNVHRSEVARQLGYFDQSTSSTG